MTQGIKGMNDILPEEIYKWQFVEQNARKIFELYGFSEIRTPLLERTELFSRSIGEDTDIVGKEMYTFIDKGGTSVTLRPEATASVLRAVIENSLLAGDPIQKLYSIGPMFRYERPQKGRYRQFYQINAERLGEDSPFSDAETIKMAYDLAASIGLKNITLEINSLGCPECRKEFKSRLQGFLNAKKGKLCEDCTRRVDTNPLRIFDCKVATCQETIADVPVIEESLCDKCKINFVDVQKFLKILNIPYTKAQRLVRGLDYYTRTTFEIKAEGLGSQNAVAGGGRYDGLVKQLGGPDVAGIGFAFGLERTIMLMEDKEASPKGCFVVMQNEAVYPYAIELINEIRNAGIQVQAVFEKSFKAQMRRADKIGYPVCIIIGEDEMNKNAVTIKDMRSSSQEQIARSQVIEKIRTLIGGRN